MSRPNSRPRSDSHRNRRLDWLLVSNSVLLSTRSGVAGSPATTARSIPSFIASRHRGGRSSCRRQSASSGTSTTSPRTPNSCPRRRSQPGSHPRSHRATRSGDRPSHLVAGGLTSATGALPGVGIGIHGQTSQRCTRAPPPPARRRTSARVAIEVSPGVVIASAPCAAPNSTLALSDSPVSKP